MSVFSGKENPVNINIAPNTYTVRDNTTYVKKTIVTESKKISFENLCKDIVRILFVGILSSIIAALIFAYLTEFYLSLMNFSVRNLSTGNHVLISLVSGFDLVILVISLAADTYDRISDRYNFPGARVTIICGIKGIPLTIHYIIIKYGFPQKKLHFQLKYLEVKFGILWGFICLIFLVKLVKWSLSEKKKIDVVVTQETQV